MLAPEPLETKFDMLGSMKGVPARGPWAALATWPRRRWQVALAGAAATIAVIGLSTAMIPNPVFGRAVPTTWWAWPALALTAVLGGLLGATYVRGDRTQPTASKAGAIGGLLSYFAVGCPVCNKIALLALGYTGALTWFAPVQPVLAIVGVALLAFALHRRLLGEIRCSVRVGVPNGSPLAPPDASRGRTVG